MTETDSGVVVKDYFVSNGKIQMIGKYTDFDRKVKNGYFSYYYSDGVLRKESFYQQDKRNGLHKSYYTNGQLASQIFYQNHLPKGTAKKWFSNGQLKDSIFQRNDTTIFMTWFSNGQLAQIGILDNEKIVPLFGWVFYHKNGKKSAEIEYDNTGKINKRTFFDENEELVKVRRPYSKDAYFTKNKNAWKKYFSKNLKKPVGIILQEKMPKIVLISFCLDEDGNVKDAYIKAPLHPDYDKAALDLVRNCPKWNPEVLFNRTIQSKQFEVEIDFDKI